LVICMFESIRFINQVYEACYSLYSDNDSFKAEEVIKKLQLPPASDEEGNYWQKKNTTNSLNILERSGLISGAIKPEYTKNLGLLKEVRHGSITSLGKKLPKFFRMVWIYIYIKKQKILAVLGVLSFVRLASNAYIGASLVSNWIEYLAALIILYILYLLLLRVFD